MKPSASPTFKVVLLGDGRVGKTSLVLRYVNNVYSDQQAATIQASYLTRRLHVGSTVVTLAIWDTAGQERFHALGPIYYRDADAALLVYDVTDSDSFKRVKSWVKELRQMAPKNIVLAIACNKSDLIRGQSLDLHEAESYAVSIGASHFVTSAKLNTGIDDVFLGITTRVLDQRHKTTIENSASAQGTRGMLIIDDEPSLPPQSKCCT